MSEKPEIIVILLSGLPASGKSTLARRLKERFNIDDDCVKEGAKVDGAVYRLLHIEYDSIEESLFSSGDMISNGRDDGFNQARRRDAWNQARQNAVDRMEQHIQKLMADGDFESHLALGPSKSLSEKRDSIILMDDNFHLRGMRKKIHRVLLKYRPIRFGILHLETPVDTCLQRNYKRSGRRQIPSDIILKMSTNFEPPRAIWELSSAKRIVNYDVAGSNSTVESKFEEIVEFIENCPTIVNFPSENDHKMFVKKKEADRAKTRKNQTHILDQLLRSYVGRISSFDKTLAKNANSARKKVMEEFKAGRITYNACLSDAFLDVLVIENEVDSIVTTEVRSQLRHILQPSQSESTE